MMAAIAAAEQGADVTLWEKNEKCGKKLYITGKGRCNITNASSAEDHQNHIFRNRRFMFSAYRQYDAASVMADLDRFGLAVKTERGARVFPVSDKSSDVIKALTDRMKSLKVSVCLLTEAKSLIFEGDRVKGAVDSKGRPFRADAVIVTCGGLSYPSTGSTGDGYRLAVSAGHTIIPCFPSLTSMNCREGICRSLAGITLKNIEMTVVDHKGKKRYQEFGDLLFTHKGISGPLVLTATGLLSGNPMPLKVRINFKPAVPKAELENRIIRLLGTAPTKQVKNLLGSLLPDKLLRAVLLEAGLSEEKTGAEVTRKERESLMTALLSFPLTVEGFGGYEEAVVTNGGINVKEIFPATMESKLKKGLYFCGEVLDVDAQTGGFNLQIAWSTGYVAGCHAAQGTNEE